MKQKEYRCPECGRTIYFDGICYECRQRRKREVYQALDDAAVAEKIEAIIAAIARTGDAFCKEDENGDFFGLLACRDISTAKIAEAAARADCFYPCELYRDATPDVREKLIALLMNPDCEEANHILQCLAIADGDDVLAAFVSLQAQPPAWAKRLHVPPSVYAWAGGWTFDEHGNRTELNYAECYPVFPLSGGNEDSELPAVPVAVPREDICPHCGSRLIDILSVDGRDERLTFLRLPGLVQNSGLPTVRRHVRADDCAVFNRRREHNGIGGTVLG
jgi:hypothetical protein